MKLNDYLEILSRRRWVIIITTMAVLVIVALGLVVVPSTYEATTKLRIMTATTGGKDYVQYDVTYTERLMQTYSEIAKSGPVTMELMNRLKVSDNDLPDVSVAMVPNTELLSITVGDADPKRAMDAANSLADILVARSKELFSNANTENVTVMEPAALPTVPSKPNKPLFLALAFLVGLVGSVALAFVIESLDTLLYSINQIQSTTQLPLLGDIPEYRFALPRGALLINNTLQAEAFRRLRTNIFFSSKSKGPRTFLVTSAVKGDGKTTIITNLTISVAKTGRKVLIIDADFRNPDLHDYFGISNEIGLSDVLAGEAKFESVVRHTEYNGVDLLPSGHIPEDPSEVLGLPSMAALIKDIASNYDIVLVDVAGSLTVTDPAVIAPYVDGVLLIVRLGYVRRAALEGTLNNLSNVNANIMGVIVNRTNRGVGTQFDRRIEKNGEKEFASEGHDTVEN